MKDSRNFALSSLIRRALSSGHTRRPGRRPSLTNKRDAVSRNVLAYR